METSDFTTSFGDLQTEVSGACRAGDEWPARVSAGIHAALRFAVANPAAARALTVHPYASGLDNSGYRQMIEHFATMLGAGAPRDKHFGASTDLALIGGIGTIVSTYVRSDRVHRLDELAPEIVYVTLVPYVGFAEANRWAESDV